MSIMEMGGKWFGAAAVALAAGSAAADSTGVQAERGRAGAASLDWRAHVPVERRAEGMAAEGAVRGRLAALRASGTPSAPGAASRRAGASAPGADVRSAWKGADGALDGRWGGFVAANSHATADRARPEGGTRDGGLAGGVDYRFTQALAGGVALSWSRTAAELRPGAGELEAHNWGLSAYASYNMGDWYVDGQLGVARLDYHASRGPDALRALGVNASARGSAEGNQWAATVGAGYDLRARELIVTPYSRVNYVRLKLDSFSEREPGAGPVSDFGLRSTESLQSALGLRLSTALRSGHRAVTPYVALEWNREFRSGSATLTAPYTPDPFTTFFAIRSERPVRDFVTVSLGLASVHVRGVSAFAKLDTVLGRDRAPGHAFIMGVRGEF